MAQATQESKRHRDYFKILGLARDATNEEIKRRYRVLALEFHPDRQRDKEPEEQEIALKRFQDVEAAYAVLSDPEKRADFERELMAEAVSLDPRIALRRFLNGFYGLEEKSGLK